MRFIPQSGTRWRSRHFGFTSRRWQGSATFLTWFLAKTLRALTFPYLDTARLIDSPLSAWSVKHLSSFVSKWRLTLDDRQSRFSKHAHSMVLIKDTAIVSCPWGLTCPYLRVLASGPAITKTPEQLHFTEIHVGKCEQRRMGGFFLLLFNGDWQPACARLLTPSGWEVLTSIKLNNTGCVTAKPLNSSLIRMIMSHRPGARWLTPGLWLELF